MTEQPQHNALVAFAALTAFLAKHPELADGYDAWAYEARTGISISPRGNVDDLVAFEALAAAFGGSTLAGTPIDVKGERLIPHYLEAELAGIPVFYMVYLRVDQDGAAS